MHGQVGASISLLVGAASSNLEITVPKHDLAYGVELVKPRPIIWSFAGRHNTVTTESGSGQQDQLSIISHTIRIVLAYTLRNSMDLMK